MSNNSLPLFDNDRLNSISNYFNGSITPTYNKSLLRYPGGKSRAVKLITSYIPQNTTKLVSPFLGGGSIEFACANNGIKVYAADAFKPLVNFWKCVIKDPNYLAELVFKYFPLSKSKFYELQENYFELEDKYLQAAAFYVLNRSSYSGTTLSGGMSPGHLRFNQNAIERLRNFRISNITISCADYKVTIKKHNDSLLYLDPPYANSENLYGKKGDMHNNFNHEELAEILNNRDGWILSYNNSDSIRDLYKNYKINFPNWNYGMPTDKQSKELLIINI